MAMRLYSTWGGFRTRPYEICFDFFEATDARIA
jgi:hypothetical protein